MSLPNGYDSRVGELGETLSGGEHQRIGLARAFLHNAPMILLDEPTSNLDSLNEALILKPLADNGGERTAILTVINCSAREKCGLNLHYFSGEFENILCNLTKFCLYP